jgi:serine/threonine-protein kinase
MGVVFRGFDPAIGRAVAIKVIRLDQFTTANEKAELKLRFAREATAAGKLSHPNIVTVYHLGEQSDLSQSSLRLPVLSTMPTATASCIAM